jgi:hypothetical protein
MNDVRSPTGWFDIEVTIDKVANIWQVQQKLLISCRVMPVVIVTTL